jgi:hypothetical protein
VVVVAKLHEFSADGLRVVVGDDGVRNPEPVDDICEEYHYLLGLDFEDRAGQNPLGKLVHGHKQVRVAPVCLS